MHGQQKVKITEVGLSACRQSHYLYINIYVTYIRLAFCRRLVVIFSIILYCDQQMHKYFTNYHTATCFDTIVSSSDSL